MPFHPIFPLIPVTPASPYCRNKMLLFLYALTLPENGQISDLCTCKMPYLRSLLPSVATGSLLAVFVDHHSRD